MKARQWILVGLFFLPGIICAQVEKGNMSTIREKQVFLKVGKEFAMIQLHNKERDM